LVVCSWSSVCSFDGRQDDLRWLTVGDATFVGQRAADDEWDTVGVKEVEVRTISGQRHSFFVSPFTTVLEMKAKMREEFGKHQKVQVFASNGRRLHDTQPLFDKIHTGEVLHLAVDIGGGGKRQRAAKAKQHDETAPLSRLGGLHRALVLPVLGFGPLLRHKCWRLAALVLEWCFNLVAAVAWAGLG
jgi:hypothetical protein